MHVVPFAITVRLFVDVCDQIHVDVCVLELSVDPLEGWHGVFAIRKGIGGRQLASGVVISPTEVAIAWSLGYDLSVNTYLRGKVVP